ncbi:MAG: transglycosylase SLT domain-containing protein [Synergistaceae bacterium]|nr:transglycosylase SLT domain-containing protein [Synergistaceae bacterium]MBR0248467.1 transglycosylase SLT domain-containing protein [Synergistaceae bacterium]
MRTRKLVIIAIFLLLFPSTSYSAAKLTKTPAVDNRARNIYALFTKANPRLEPVNAKKYAEIVIEASEKFKQDPYVIAAIIVHESTVNNKAVSKGGDYGLMQVRWKIHEKAIKQRFPKVKNAKDMFDARTNIMFGTEIFSDCMKKCDNDVQKGLMRYSAGNTKMRDKVMSTVKELRSKDNATKTKKKGK